MTIKETTTFYLKLTGFIRKLHCESKLLIQGIITIKLVSAYPY